MDSRTFSGIQKLVINRTALVLDIESSDTERSPSEASFEPYARLLRMLMPSLRGVVVHDGFTNQVWATDDWDVPEGADIVKQAITNTLIDPGEFAGIMVTLDADRTVYSFAVRGDHIELLGVVSLSVRMNGTQAEPRPLHYIRQLVQPALECLKRRAGAALEARIARARSDRARTRYDAHAGDVLAQIRHRQRCRRIRSDPENGSGTHGLHTGRPMGAREEHLVVPDAQRCADAARAADSRRAAPDGLDVAAAAHHHHQPHREDRERGRGALQDPRLPDPPPVGAGHRRARAVQPAELRRTSTCIRRESRSCWPSAPPS